MTDTNYRLLPVALHPAIEEALKRHCMMPNTAWQDVIAAWDRVNRDAVGSGDLSDDIKQRTERIRLAHANPAGRSKTHLIRDVAHLLAHIALAAPERSGKTADDEPIGEVMAKPVNESGTLQWPRVVWKDGLFAVPPVGTKLYTRPAASSSDEVRNAALALWNSTGEQLQKADDTLRSLSAYVGQGGCWDTENLDYAEMEARIKEGIDTFVKVESSPAASSSAAPSVSEDVALKIKRAIIGLRDGWISREEADEAIALLTPSVQAVAAGQELTDAEAHDLMQRMQAHMYEWADANDNDDTDEDCFPAFSGECLRFLLRHLTKPPALAGDTKAGE